MRVLDVRKPVYGSADGESITLEVYFDHLGGFVPFGASPKDPEPHGRELFEKAKRGDFGAVAPFVAPPENKREKLVRAFKKAVETMPEAEVDAMLSELRG